MIRPEKYIIIIYFRVIELDGISFNLSYFLCFVAVWDRRAKMEKNNMKRGRIREVDHEHRSKPWARLGSHPRQLSLRQGQEPRITVNSKTKGTRLKFKTDPLQA